MNQNVLPLIGAGFRESSSLLFRLREKLYDKYFWSPEDMRDAENSMQFLKEKYKKNKELRTYLEEGFSTGTFKKFKRGFHTKSIRFQTNNQTWIVKIGHRISPVVDLGDPSDYSYFTEYKHDLEMLQSYCKKNKQLSFFIPNPQFCFWMGRSNQEGKILILQPFVHIAPLEKTIKRLDDRGKKQLQNELEAIQTLQKTFMEKYKKQFDFLGEDNIVLVRHDNTYHFALLDLGLINLNKPLPITQLVMQLSYDMTITKLKSLLQ